MNGTILVFGRNGQVARELAKLGARSDPSLAGLKLDFVGREDFDLSRGDSPLPLLRERAPIAVINAAAYTAVDRAESEPEAAFQLNRDTPAGIAQACAALDIPLVHFSTDYVFDGSKPDPYVEDDPPNPMSVYGRSKAEGEMAVLGSGARASVLRTAWVYSAFGSNFLKTMLRLGRAQPEIRVVADQIGQPTWAEDCALGALRLVQALLDRDARSLGVFHLTGAGDATWADFAEAIFEESARRGGSRPAVSRITTAQYPTAARRPPNSRLDCRKIMRTVGWSARDWRGSLKACFDELSEEGA